MAKASLIGLITQGPELQHSAKGEPYVRFSVAEYVGFGLQRHTQFVDVWAWGYMAQRLAKCTLSNGDFIFLSGTLELEEFTKKDGITKDKRLKLRLDDWAPVPQSGKQSVQYRMKQRFSSHRRTDRRRPGRTAGIIPAQRKRNRTR